ncbi:hypothetical protein K9U39_14865 [Rhodoblastus acidophilus]|uniref:Uncharacterized protein n=1 Tax=Candidatus Rhodoblastus alkanivorans TaxID=2954117 RepID=A0ABS9ZCS4_9HYPH|nr:hypothetical protein [Candidatus Rhodoblastus alkanivorans]MCI4680468.1 hypothetical protein [Candidatus Rhodoblastus alkanivorans]MCI4684887.1 hypothetical protein [Candidatus Rhodoblastus alkanivorans]MDI4642211.1 hypothetical protein [Rhodoblastus acidophilus]
MSRKSIQINVPAAQVQAPVKAPARRKSGAEGMVDSWIVQDAAQTLAEDAFSPHPIPGEGVTVTVRLSAQPDWAEAAKIFFFLPQAALWFWTFGAAQKAMRLPFDWRR